MINQPLKTLWPYKISIHSVANIQQINMLSIHFDRFWHMDGRETRYNQDNKGIHYSELPRILCKTVLLLPLTSTYWCVCNDLLHRWLLLRHILLLPTQKVYFYMRFPGCVNSCFCCWKTSHHTGYLNLLIHFPGGRNAGCFQAFDVTN